VEEITYRQSPPVSSARQAGGVCRGRLLTNGKDLSTSKIAKAIGRGVPRASNILGALRLAELVRYETLWIGIFLLTINFAAVSNPENSYDSPRIINFIDGSVIADANAPVVLGTS
jgi:hypothetical protein